MEVRDKLNTLEGYQEIISKKRQYVLEDFTEIKSLIESENIGIQKFSKPNLEVIHSTKATILINEYDILFAIYSSGESIENFKIQYFKTIESMQGVWKQSNGYVKMVLMLSIGIILDIHSDEFEKLVKMVGKDNPKDFLIDFLIKSRKNDWNQHENFKFKIPFQTTKEIVELASTDKNKAVERLQKYLQKDWYRSIETKTHESKFNIHSGYWSFESGALVKILGLDDSTLKDQQYYPYDLVHCKS